MRTHLPFSEKGVSTEMEEAKANLKRVSRELESDPHNQELLLAQDFYRTKYDWLMDFYITERQNERRALWAKREK